MLSNLLCRCEDYILIDRGDSGTIEICGNSTSTADMILLSNNFKSSNLTVIFRTSESVQGHGFQMFVFCAAPDDPGIMHTCVYRLPFVYI